MRLIIQRNPKIALKKSAHSKNARNVSAHSLNAPFICAYSMKEKSWNGQSRAAMGSSEFGHVKTEHNRGEIADFEQDMRRSDGFDAELRDSSRSSGDLVCFLIHTRPFQTWTSGSVYLKGLGPCWAHWCEDCKDTLVVQGVLIRPCEMIGILLQEPAATDKP
ncbi:hypothetical protein MA16_Dca017950 [Dendrobium catenatum]|uniref:Uncharacterized protein n=1 Tax=Dendrobium catenatum TaxID=906689 RepID=A0A2I0X9H6_9ASPA|nr:hypothetical protein MA16_Dca017950 [Dendrobium catenatum]